MARNKYLKEVLSIIKQAVELSGAIPGATTVYMAILYDPIDVEDMRSRKVIKTNVDLHNVTIDYLEKIKLDIEVAIPEYYPYVDFQPRTYIDSSSGGKTQLVIEVRYKSAGAANLGIHAEAVERTLSSYSEEERQQDKINRKRTVF